jgi:hypothetical protein
MTNTTDQKKTHTPRKVEKRAPRRPAVGYSCTNCNASGLAPSDFVGANCIDCATGADLGLGTGKEL